MTDKIKVAAEARAQYISSVYRKASVADFLAGASYALKESGVEELREAAKILAKAANDLDDVYVHSDSFKTKMNALFDSADKCSASLSKSDLFFNDKNSKDGKDNNNNID